MVLVMSFRFRRSIEILPGIRLNIGKRGVSTSIGVRGAHITVGHGEVRETVGIPGSGLSYTHVDKTHAEGAGAAERGAVIFGCCSSWRSPRYSWRHG
jgi:hypothetical protein